MAKKYNLVGSEFGRLTVTRAVIAAQLPAELSCKRKRAYWECACSCGGSRIASTTELRSGKVSHCGCDAFGSMASDLVGQRFGSLVVERLEASGGGSRAGRRWLCRCDCGDTRVVSSGHLRAGYVFGCAKCGKAARYAKVLDAKHDSMHAEDGMVFGNLTVIGPDYMAGGGCGRRCRCRCGNETVVAAHTLRSGRVRNCRACLGRFHWARHWRSLRRECRGARFGMLTIRRIAVVSGSAGGGSVQEKRVPIAVCDCDCGTRGYRVLLSSLKSGNTIACGCQKYVVPEERRGANHPWYNHDLTDEEREAGRSFEGQDAFRSSIYRRDDYTCQACGQRGGRLAGHHIKPWAYFRAHRLVKRNIVTLCKGCHESFHERFGKQDPGIWRSFVGWIRERRKETGFKQ